MANDNNLIPLTERGKEEAKRIRQQGQAAQVASRRRKKALKEAADFFHGSACEGRTRAQQAAE